MKIAFIGLGRMGVGMARNLLRAGHTVAVFNRSREKAEALAADGARSASSPADACRDAEVVMSMVADDHAVEEIVFGSDGIASALKSGCIHVSHSTISTALDRAWKIADHIMTQPRVTRRLTTQIVRRPWKKRITDDLDGGFGIQMFAHLAKKKSIHSRNHIASSVAYVKEGKENNIK